jgi:hypothetical protein
LIIELLTKEFSQNRHIASHSFVYLSSCVVKTEKPIA